MGTFADTFEEEIARIPWLGGATGRAVARVVGAQQDAELRKLKDAVLMRCPSLAPVDALELLAADRFIGRAPPETALAFAARLDQVNDLCEWWGTKTGIINIFAPYNFDAATVQVLNNDEVAGSWDGNTDWFSRVFLFLDSRSGYFQSDGVWEDSGSVDVWAEDGDSNAGTWDSTALLADLAYLRNEVRKFKAPGAYPVAIAVWLDDNMPDGYWDSPGGAWPEDDPDAGGAVWCEDEDCRPLYWTLGNVYGQEAWLGDGVDTWIEDDEAAMMDLEEADEWVAFPGEE